MVSAARIVALRKNKGMSQEVLAEESGVSLRTIQRVEQGETVPRGHTVQALAAALGVPIEALLPEPEPKPIPVALPAAAAPALRPDRSYLELLNLSALSFLVFPLLNLVVPFLLWRKRRHDTELVAEVGRRVLGFQVLWQVACFFLYLLAAGVQVVVFRYFQVSLRGLFLLVFLFTYTLNLLVVLYNARQLKQGNLNLYPIRL
ncbi:helix-turn-helix domain-containing protein [Hymenobacter tenuis]